MGRGGHCFLHSYRSAIIGSTFVARLAGIQQARRANRINSTATPAKNRLIGGLDTVEKCGQASCQEERSRMAKPDTDRKRPVLICCPHVLAALSVVSGVPLGGISFTTDDVLAFYS